MKIIIEDKTKNQHRLTLNKDEECESLNGVCVRVCEKDKK